MSNLNISSDLFALIKDEQDAVREYNQFLKNDLPADVRKLIIHIRNQESIHMRLLLKIKNKLLYK